jgi:hypothetical protein
VTNKPTHRIEDTLRHRYAKLAAAGGVTVGSFKY